jgi:hypothetical protein
MMTRMRAELGGILGSTARVSPRVSCRSSRGIRRPPSRTFARPFSVVRTKRSQAAPLRARVAIGP